MSKFIVSANYRDRDSKYKWLVREEGQKPQEAIAVLAVICVGVAFCPATDWETGFGCSTIALCDDVSYKAEDVEPVEVDLKFSGHSFYNGKNVVETVAELTLGSDGKMKAKLNRKGRKAVKTAV